MIDDLRIVTFIEDGDKEWLTMNEIIVGKSAKDGDHHFKDKPCVIVYPTKKQLILLILKYGERLIKFPNDIFLPL